MKKDKCIICGNTQLNEILNIKNFPVFMGATTLPENDFLYEDLIYGSCSDCSTLQMLNLIPLNVLYQDNHNTEVVGKTWETHNQNFAKFIKWFKPKVVFEIGSPSATIYKKLENEEWLTKWYSLEPNPSSLNNVTKKFKLIQGWVDKDFSFKKLGIETPDCVVMSHVFEHLYNPTEILDILYQQLNDNGAVIISVPNMEYISNNNLMPPSGLHFEHTFYLNFKNVKYLLEKSGFKLISYEDHINHSNFYLAIKQKQKLNTDISKVVKDNQNNLELFNKTIEHYSNLVSEINDQINNINGKIYIYGSHFPAQFLCALGLNLKKISGCLDQSKTKIGKKLYGTNFNVYSPEILKNENDVFVICHMGPYTNEIKETIKNINNKVIFL